MAVARSIANTIAHWRLPGVARRVRSAKLTYLPADAVLGLYEQVRRIERDRVPGDLVECGCALGGSAIVLAATKSPHRALHVYDVFGMIPPPGAKDGADVHARYEVIRSGRADGIGGDRYYGYEVNLQAVVRENFRRMGYAAEDNNVRLVKGLFQDTLHPTGPVALAHIDGDFYESVRCCLERLGSHLSRGAVFVIDDYYAWSGCRRAVDEWLAAQSADHWNAVQRHSRLHIEHKADPESA